MSLSNGSVRAGRRDGDSTAKAEKQPTYTKVHLTLSGPDAAHLTCWSSDLAETSA